MPKLNSQEIEKNKNLENTEISLPRNAHSVFQFDIEENIADLKKDMENRNGADFKIAKTSPHNYEIIDPDFEYSSGGTASLHLEKNSMTVETALSGFKYSITESPKGGSSVTFEGPANALLNQNLLPKMSYVPKTLKAKFIDGETGKDLTDYLDIHSYGLLRAEKNKKANDWGEKGNNQDKYGYNINAKFNNEIDFLPLSDRIQEKANTDVKETIDIALHKVRDMLDKKSAAALDNIAAQETPKKQTAANVKNTSKDLER